MTFQRLFKENIRNLRFLSVSKLVPAYDRVAALGADQNPCVRVTALSAPVFLSNSETFWASLMCLSFPMLIPLGGTHVVKPHLVQLNDFLPVISMILLVPFSSLDFLRTRVSERLLQYFHYFFDSDA